MSDKLNINVKKAFGGFNLEIKQALPLKGITSIFGPSGAGKSSLLKLIAGFETPDKGHLSMKGNIWFDNADKINMRPYKRAVGYMFQEGRLFPHMTIKQNLEFAAKRATKRISIENVILAFDLDNLLEKPSPILSGGERRRVALARTVLTGPEILLLDEPLTGLDRARKRDILPFIESLPSAFNIPCLYVTHDIEEVSRLADNIMVMSEGKLSGFGNAGDVLSRLDTTPLDASYDVSSLIKGHITTHDKNLHMMQADIGGEVIHLPQLKHANINDKIRLRIHASDVALSLKRPVGISIRNIIAVTISDIMSDETTPHTMITLKLADQKLRARITRMALQDMGLCKGMNIYALIKSVSFEGRL